MAITLREYFYFIKDVPLTTPPTFHAEVRTRDGVVIYIINGIDELAHLIHIEAMRDQFDIYGLSEHLKNRYIIGHRSIIREGKHW